MSRLEREPDSITAEQREQVVSKRAEPAAAALPCSTPYVRYVICLLTLVSVVNYMDRMALAVLMPSIKADLALSDGQLGLLVGFAFFVFYALCGIPIARWADHGTRRNIIAIALATWSVMTALSGAAQNFWHLLIARVGMGAGEAGSIPPSQSLICDYVPPQRRSSVFAFHNFGVYAGLMLGMATAGWLGDHIGWRWTFVTLGLPGIVLALIVRTTLREPTRGYFDAGQEDPGRAPLFRAIRALWRCKTYRLLTYFSVMNGFLQYGMTQWWPSFYSRVFELSLSSVGVYLGIAIGVGSGLGLLMGGLLGNRAAQRDPRLPLMLCSALTLFALPAALGTLFVPSAAGSILLVSLTGVFWSVSNGPLIATVYTVTTPRMRATAGAIMISCTSILGFGLGPSCVGLLSDFLTASYGNEALRYALLAPVCVLPPMVVALYAAARALPNDLARR